MIPVLNLAIHVSILLSIVSIHVVYSSGTKFRKSREPLHDLYPIFGLSARSYMYALSGIRYIINRYFISYLLKMRFVFFIVLYF